MKFKQKHVDNGKGQFVNRLILDFNFSNDFSGLEKEVIKERMDFTNPKTKIREYLQKREGMTFPNKFPDYNIEENEDIKNQHRYQITSVSEKLNDGSYSTSEIKDIYLKVGESYIYPIYSNPKLEITIDLKHDMRKFPKEVNEDLSLIPKEIFNVESFMNYLKTGEISS